MRRISRPAVLVVLAIVSGSAAAADGAEVKPASTPPVAGQLDHRSEGRMLNGHVFIPAASVPDALHTTSFGSSLLLGYGKTTGTFQVEDARFDGSFEYAGVGSTLRYEHAFLRYFSAIVTVDELIYSGLDASSIFAVGTRLQVGGTLGVKAGVPLADTVRVAALFEAGYVPALALTLREGTQNLLLQCQGTGPCHLDPRAFLGTENAVTVRPGMAVSWAPSRALGVTGFLSYEHISQSRNIGILTSNAVVSAAAVDLDCHAVSPVPIGFLLQLDWTAPLNASGLEHVVDLGGGIFYTGRDDLSLGLELVARRFAVRPGLDVSWRTFLSTVAMRYFW